MNSKFKDLAPSVQQKICRILGQSLSQVDSSAIDIDADGLKTLAAASWETALIYLLEDPAGSCFMQAMAVSQRMRLKHLPRIQGVPEVLVRPISNSLTDPFDIASIAMERRIAGLDGTIYVHYYQPAQFKTISEDLLNYFHGFINVARETCNRQSGAGQAK